VCGKIKTNKEKVMRQLELAIEKRVLESVRKINELNVKIKNITWEYESVVIQVKAFIIHL
jgi:hypothetical protein